MDEILPIGALVVITDKNKSTYGQTMRITGYRPRTKVYLLEGIDHPGRKSTFYRHRFELLLPDAADLPHLREFL